MPRRGSIAAVMVVGSALVLAAYGGGPGTQTDRRVDYVAIVARGDQDVFKLYKSQLGSGTRQVFGLDETLARKGDATSPDNVQPGLAQTWATMARSATFTLKLGDVGCAGGTPLTTSGAADSLRYFADPKTGATFESSVTDPFSQAQRPENVANPDFDAAVARALAIKADGHDRCKAWHTSKEARLREVDVKPLVWPAVAWFNHDLTFTGRYTMVELRSIRATRSA